MNTGVESKSTRPGLGYAVPREWYEQYVREPEAAPDIKNRNLAQSGHGGLKKESDYWVVSPREWQDIKKRYAYDVELPTGTVTIHVTLRGKNQIEKRFETDASKNIFEIIQVVLFSHRITVGRFSEKYSCSITNSPELTDALIKCEAEDVEIEIEKRESGKQKKRRTEKSSWHSWTGGAASVLDSDSSSRDPDTQSSTSSDSESGYESDRVMHRPDFHAEISRSAPASFHNVGLSCYMNTALQVLLGTEDLSSSLLGVPESAIRRQAQKKSNVKGHCRKKAAELIFSYRYLIQCAKKGNECGSALREVKRILGTIDPRYWKCAEEDAGEVVSLILNTFWHFFAGSKYESLVTDLFMYCADILRVYFDAEGNEIHAKTMNIYKALVLNGSFGSETGAHSHVLVVHENQLHTTSFCVPRGPGGQIQVVTAKERISRVFQVSPECIEVAEIRDDQKVLKRENDHVFTPQKSLVQQPIFWIASSAASNGRLFLLLKMSSEKDGGGILTTIFGQKEKKLFRTPYLIESPRDVPEFLEHKLGLKRKKASGDGNELIQVVSQHAETPSTHPSVTAIVPDGIWDVSKYAEAVRGREGSYWDSLHVQCVVTNWEYTTPKKKIGSTEKEKGQRKPPGAQSFVDSMHFCRFSKYICILLPEGLGSPEKGEKTVGRVKLTLEKDGLVLDGRSYGLVGVLVHHNFGVGGHYVAFTKRGNQWYHCNDSTITQATPEEAVSTGYPYGVLYRGT